MKRVLLVVFFVTGNVFAGSISFSPQFTNADFSQLAEALGDLLVFPNLTTATPSGIAGFEVMGVMGGLRASESEPWWRHAIGEDASLGVLPAPRVVVRKGLPLGLDVGLQVGKLAGERFLGGELRWSLTKAGLVLPAVALAASYSRLDHQLLDFRVGELKLVISKGLVLISPFGGVAVQRHEAEARFGEPTSFWHRLEGNQASAFAGVVFHPLPFVRVVAEARRGSFSSYFLALGVGL